MRFKVIIERGSITFEVSPDELDYYIENHCGSGEVRFVGYILDEAGNAVGIKGLADLGHGYGFDYGWKEFCLKSGESYTFTHEYTSVDGPSDWNDESFKVTLRLQEAE